MNAVCPVPGEGGITARLCVSDRHGRHHTRALKKHMTPRAPSGLHSAWPQGSILCNRTQSLFVVTYRSLFVPLSPLGLRLAFCPHLLHLESTFSPTDWRAPHYGPKTPLLFVIPEGTVSPHLGLLRLFMTWFVSRPCSQPHTWPAAGAAATHGPYWACPCPCGMT